MADISSWNLAEVKQDLIIANRECSQRRLLHSAKWCAELSFALNKFVDVQPILTKPETQDFLLEYDQFTLATTYFDLKEYDRAGYFLEDCTSPKCYFLNMYSRYLADEKRKLDKASDSIGPAENVENEHLKTLRIELSKKYVLKELDGYSLYLYGVILKKLDLVKDAVEVLLESIHKEPLHWGTWQELVPLINDREMLLSLSLPDHWIKQFFLAHTYLELQLNDEALRIYQELEENGFHKSSYIVAQVAVAFHNMRDVDSALNSFKELQKLDPYRLENMDTYSNLLYVKEMRYELAHLAHGCCDIDKFRVETCCVIGNYYSLRSQHEKAVLYFQRSVKLNPLYLSAWTLMGHEFMEMKNTNAAIQAYRQAIEVNKRDYRAWYGLGQTYEILNMPYYCLYYYRIAQKLRKTKVALSHVAKRHPVDHRNQEGSSQPLVHADGFISLVRLEAAWQKPNDSRMIMALGECYEKLDRLQEAKKCFWKAHRIGDIEETSLYKLAKLHERLKEDDQAAGAYTEFINNANIHGTFSYEAQSEAYKYLANYHLKQGNIDAAQAAAQKCSEFTETREEAKALLKQIQQLRIEHHLKPPADVRMDDSYTSMANDPSASHNTTPLYNFAPMSLRFNTP